MAGVSKLLLQTTHRGWPQVFLTEDVFLYIISPKKTFNYRHGLDNVEVLGVFKLRIRIH